MSRKLWMAIVFGTISAGAVYGQEKPAMSLSLAPYHNLPTTEGYFQGADGAHLFFRVVGKEGNPIVFLHGGPGLGLEDGGYDMEPFGGARAPSAHVQ